MFKNMKVAYRLTLLASVLLVLLLATGLTGINGMKSEYEAMQTVYIDRVVPLKDLKVVADLYAVNIVDTSHKLRGGTLGWDEALQNINNASKTIDELWTAYLKTQLVPEEERLVEQMRPLMQMANQKVDQLRKIVSNEDRAALIHFVDNQLYPAIDPISEKFSGLVDVQLVVAEKEYLHSIEKYEFTLYVNVTILIMGVLISIVLSIMITRSLLTQLGGEPNYTQDVITRVANGDLSFEIVTAKHDTESVLYSVRQMVEKLSEIIFQVRSSADNLSAASEQMSSAAQSISQSASEQAASVEETSAAMEQMSASINQNNENSKITDGIANKSAKEAQEGGVAVRQTVEAMQQIADKISIIDDIAYQTNLLALNAAIEAGRAGEHGRGFAVVAAEVRKLAARSQTAAQEIGEVASNSVSLAQDAGRLLSEIVPSIQKTAELVQEISAASSEQATGANEINSAISQITQATQVNSSASEELASTSEELTEQAEDLLRMISFFTLKEQPTSVLSSQPAKRKKARVIPVLSRKELRRPEPVADDADFDFEQF